MIVKQKYLVGIGAIIILALLAWAKKSSDNGSFSLPSLTDILPESANLSAITIPDLPNMVSTDASKNVPWWLTYNNDPSYYHLAGLLPLPNNSAGQSNESCTVCNLFPNFSTVQL